MGLAHIQEIRDAVTRFQASGKPAFAYAETFGEFGPGNGGYYLATAFDEIYLQPSGDLGMTGLMYETPFIGGLLEKLDITPEMFQRFEYKNAMNFYTERLFTEPHERALRELMDSQFGQLLRGIAEGRGLSEEQVRTLFDSGPFLADGALEEGLVDGLAYRDEVYDRVYELAGNEAEPVHVSSYLRVAGRPYARGETIALIHGYGSVVRGWSSYSPIDGSVTMGADTIAAAFRAAVEDDRVKAIIFRVDSPGGSYVASDTIWRETILARDAEKPVIVSMGNLAGSGGYFVAIDADKIVAQPGSITGSIGVLGGKFLTRESWERIGVTWDDVHTSSNSRIWTGTYDYGASRPRIEAVLDRIYEDFTEKVAEGRGLPLETVQEIARGRIWTGEDARTLGLVDELGGMDVAIRLAREAADLDPDAAIRLKRFPPRRSTLQLLLERTAGSEGPMLAAMTRMLEVLQPKVRMLQRLGLSGDPGPLSVPHLGSPN